jgi:hypothetical protein
VTAVGGVISTAKTTAPSGFSYVAQKAGEQLSCRGGDPNYRLPSHSQLGIIEQPQQLCFVSRTPKSR